MRVITYAIGDIHGRKDLLDRLLAMIQADAESRAARSKIVFTGDYVDRGPDSHGVVERLIAGPGRGVDSFICLCGNHDDIFIRAVTTGEDVPDWAWQLFEATIESYGRDESAMRRHAGFFAGLPLTHDDGVNLFVHAGIRPDIPLDRQEKQDLIWIREEFLDYEQPLPRRVVHGHTIMGDRPVVTSNRVSIDTGAYRSGILTAAVFDGDTLRFLQAIGAPDPSFA